VPDEAIQAQAPDKKAGPGKKGADAEYKIEPFDVLNIFSSRSLPDQAINGNYPVLATGTVRLGLYGSVKVDGLTLDGAKQEIERHMSAFVREAPGCFIVTPRVSRSVPADLPVKCIMGPMSPSARCVVRCAMGSRKTRGRVNA
jgi:protein involved in polysaccharide export with SLBB domain